MAHCNKKKERKEKKRETLDMERQVLPYLFFFLVGGSGGGGGDSGTRDGNGEFSKREIRTRDGKK